MRLLSRLALGVGAAAAVVGLAVAPATAAVTATATPNSNLTDQQTVSVTASGLPARTTVAVIECKRGATSSADCEGNTADVSGQTDNSGNFALNYQVFTLPNAIFPSSSITCDATHQCDLYVGLDFNDFSRDKAFVPISFAATQSTTTTTQGPVTPETSRAVLLPLTAFAVVGGAAILSGYRRRRTATSAK